MSDTPKGRVLQRCGRLYAFALPHWKLILATTLALAVYSAANGAFLLIVRPVFQAAQDASLRKTSHGPAAYEPDKRAESVLSSRWVRAMPGPVRRLVEKAVRPGPDQLSCLAGIIAFGLAPLLGLTAFAALYLENVVQAVVIADLREKVFARLVLMPVRFFDQHRIGELISRLTNDISRSQTALQFLFGEIVLSPCKVVIGLAAAVHFSWELSLICFVGMPLVAFVLRHFGRRVYRHAKKSLTQLGVLTDAINQMFSGIHVVKAFQMEKAEVCEFKKANQAQLHQTMKLGKNRALGTAVPEAIYGAGIALILLLGNRLIHAGRLDMSTLAGFALAAVFIVQPVRSLSKGYSRLQEALAASDRLFELNELPVVEPDPPDAVALDGVHTGVTFRQVTFSYVPGRPVLQDVSLVAPAGHIIAVVGETGSGKTTLLNLIPRFHDPDSGEIEVDGIDVRRIKRDSLLAQIAIVSQHPFLFNRSIEENIRYGRPGASLDEVQAAARQAGIHEFVVSLPEGYASLVGERGAFLSGGQRQCITIARAILKDAPILILDEATSSLDAASEELVHKAFANLMQGRTTFVIAHRLSTIRNADLIVVMKNGRVVEVGSHDELLAARGEFYRLYTVQFGATDAGRA